ncbi:MAG TPA: WecB/TagA/CpsF family glycosyltransferase [Acidimicrobiia bacterium]|nr:WecB/TagA/CpsF family glycosyltransferase [Acidimicrobiia bacterium]
MVSRGVAGVELQRVRLGGMPCDLVSRAGAEQLLLDAMRGVVPDPVLVASANLDKVFHFGTGRPNEGFFDDSARRDQWVVLLDGAPLVTQARRVAPGDWARLAGADLLPVALDLAAQTGARVGFLGGNTAGNQALTGYLATRWPALEVAGTWAPDSSTIDQDGESVAAAVRAARTDVLVVALTPRSESWLDRWAGEAGIRLGLAFGAAAQFMTGERRRAPALLQRAGLEWAWRLATEPRRLARRYLVEGPQAYWILRRHSG